MITAIFADRYFFDRKLSYFGPAVIKKPASLIFSRIESARFFLRGLGRIRSVISENENLKKENFTLLSQLADHEDLKNENDFLRRSLGISARFNSKVAYANIYYFQLGLDGYDVLLNKGGLDGVSDGDILITDEGILVGSIENAYDKFSRVLFVNDTDFRVTAKVLKGSGTLKEEYLTASGIARGTLNQGMYFDLILQSDSIKEGDVVVSSGMDLIPPALIIGTVSYVETNEADLFKKVKIRPAIEEVKIGRVLVIRR